MKRTPEHQAKLTASLRAKWASGTRKNGNTPEAKQKIAQSLRAAYAEGRRPKPVLTAEEASRRRALANPVRLAAVCRELAVKKIGVPNPPGPSAASPGHWRAKFWRVYAPNGDAYQFVNLSNFVRENSHLFEAADIVWRGSSCRAVKRLSDAGNPRNIKREWKGWVVSHKAGA